MSSSIRPARSTVHGALILLAAVAVALVAAAPFRSMGVPDRIVPASGVKATALSRYFPPLHGTAGDTAVYVREGVRPGGTALVLGGTHGDEPAGYLAAVILVEQGRVEAGRLIVIPRANASGFTHNLPQEAHPSAFALKTPAGDRWFTFGARATNPAHQWPDPQVYTLPGSGQTLSGSETRNLNRAYPGRPDGTLTERIAYAITTLIRREGVALACDLHEASPEYPVVNTMVAHERAIDLAAIVNMNLQSAGVEIGLEPSPANLHGLSHREWGDATPALAVLAETTSPVQGRYRGATGADLVITGRDRFYERAALRGRLSVPFSRTGWPIDVRVARQLATVTELLKALSELEPAHAVTLRGIPAYEELIRQGIGPLLVAGVDRAPRLARWP